MVRKKLVIVAYDIRHNRRRNKLAKFLEAYGNRINLSVFECMFTDAELTKTITTLGTIIDKGTDQVVYYTICQDCYTKTVMQPELKRDTDLTVII